MPDAPILYKDRIKEDRLNLIDIIPLSGPLTVHIEPTNICNFKCKFCPESFDNYKEKAGGNFMLSNDDYDIIINQLKTLPRLKQLNFFMMGEPFANKNTLSFIKTATENNISYSYMVSSNGALLTSEKYQRLCESGLNYLRISIFGSNEQIHRNITQSKIDLERVKNNIRNFKKFKEDNNFIKPTVMVKMIESENPEHNKEFLDNFTGLGDETLIEPLTNWNDPDEGNLSMVDKKNLLSTDHYKKRKKCCPYPFYSMVIHSDLKVSICCVDWEKKTFIGDLKKESIKDIWNGKLHKDIQLKHINGQKKDVEGCKSCTYHYTAKDNLDNLNQETFLERLENKTFS
tara:strand:+ start:133 stop:1164 length:1032 start_codon:yes stop_codon:yes gene_type:complete